MRARQVRVHWIWSALAGVAAIVAAEEIPIALLFPVESRRALSVLEWVLTLVFVADLVFHLQLAGKLHVGGAARQSGRSSRYGKAWLVVDALAAIPFQILPVPAVFRLLLLAKLGRVGQLMHRWRQHDVHRANLLRLLFFLFWLALLAHWIACGWLALRGIAPEFDPLTNYVRAIYWCVTTLTTVGYGDITPVGNAQMLFAVAVMMLGAAVYGYTIANVASILANIDPAKVRYQEMVEKMTAFMKYRNVPPHLQRRILEYNTYLWEKRLGYDESTAISGLPPSLRSDVLLFLNGDIIERVPLFRGASEEFVRAIALEMRPTIFTPGDYIIRAGEQGHEMYFISRGRVEIVSPDGKAVYATLTDGDFFGEMALLHDQPRSASARATDYCDLYLLEKATFNHVLDRFPEFASHIAEVAGKRRQGNQPASEAPE